MGIAFGDLGTSPLYTLNAVFHGKIITENIALGSLSAIFWTLTFQTTIKYILITMQADNKGEGGILSLYALIRRFYRPWLIVPAMAGAAFMIADGIITPPISVTSAVEGLTRVAPHLNIVGIVIAILVGLFIFQQFGTEKIGRVFGPVMMLWFLFIGAIGVYAIGPHWDVFLALNPVYAYRLLAEEPGGFWFLGAIFLCTTGAEALYSDMGHCGRNNIRVSWIFIKIALLLCYAGQVVWLTQHTGQPLDDISPFYHIVPDALFWPGLVIATLATIIASQALLSGCFTLINEAIRLGIWPRQLVLFPSNVRGQIYIPFINWMLLTGCIFMVLHFKESTRMEAAFGLSVTLTMLMSTVLITFYLLRRKVHPAAVLLLTVIFLTIETGFLIANFQKIKDGGWITLVIGLALFGVMYSWWKGRRFANAIQKTEDLAAHIPLLKQLSVEQSVPQFADNAVYLTTSALPRRIEKNILDSIFKPGNPKRADAYWFVHVNTVDEPYTRTYSVETLAGDDLYFITFNLGFRVEPRLDLYFRQVANEMVDRGEIDVEPSIDSQYNHNRIGGYRFVVTESFLSYDNEMPFWKNLLMRVYYLLRRLSVSNTQNFGLDKSNVLKERFAVVISPTQGTPIRRVEQPAASKAAEGNTEPES